MAAAVATALAPLVAGAALVDAWGRGTRRSAAERWAALLLGAGLGLGAQSCLFFVWSLGFGTPRAPGFGWIPATGLAAAVALWTAARRQRPAAPAAPAVAVATDRARAVLVACFAATAIAAAVRFAIRSAEQPHGSWDAWAIWNLHARWIARGGEHWLGFLSLDFGQPSYPLLLPTAIASVWIAAGAEAPVVAIGFAAFFAAATVGLLVSALAAARDLGAGLIGGIALLATPLFAVQASAQYADVPLCFFALATAVSLHRALSTASGPRALGLAGVCAGLASWTKDEGWLLIAVSGAVVAAHGLATGGARAAMRRIAPFAAGVAPIALLAGAFKLILAPAGWLTRSMPGPPLLERVTDLERAGGIVLAFLRETLELGQLFASLPFLPSVPVLLLLLPWVVSRRPRFQRDPAALAILALAAGMVAGYAGVYLATPLDLEWQLSTSLSRVLLHVWPIAIFGWLLLAPALEDEAP